MRKTTNSSKLLAVLLTLTLCLSLLPTPAFAAVTVTLSGNGGYFGGIPANTDVTMSGTSGTSLDDPGNTGYQFPERAGYTCIGYATSGSATVPSTYLTLPTSSGSIFYAVWQADTVAVTFDPDGGLISGNYNSVTMTGKSKSALTSPTPVRDGYAFNGWSVVKNSTTSFPITQFPTEDTTYYPVWTPLANHTIIFDIGTRSGAGGGTCTGRKTGVTLTQGGALPPTSILPYVGETFSDYWMGSDGFVYSSAQLADYVIPGTPTTHTFTGIFLADDKATVIFDFNGGKDAGNANFSTFEGFAGQTVSAPTGVTRAGYGFGGWVDSTNTNVNPPFAYGAAGSITVYKIKWNPTYNTVTYATTADGTLSGFSTEMVYTGASPVNVPTANANTGYSFSGWLSSEGGLFQTSDLASYVVTSNVQFTAQYTQINKASMLFDYAGGTLSGNTYKLISGVSGATVAASDIPAYTSLVRPGYTCSGWDSTPASAYGAAGTVSIYTAQWTPVSTYTVDYTFSPAAAATVSGLPATVSTAVYGQSVGGTVPNPTSANTAYVFSGYYKIYVGGADTGMLTTAPTSVSVAGNMTFEALFDAVSATAVTVSFDTNGGTWTAAGNTAYPGGMLSNLPGSALTAPTATDMTRDGYDLTGFTPTVPAAFPGTNASYAAQWTAKTYTVTFNQGTNGTLSVNPATTTVAYNGTATVPALTVAGGYAFLGWQNSIDGGLYDDAAVAAYSIRADVTFTAQYAPVSAGTATVVFNYAGGTDGTNGFQVITGTPGTPVSIPTGLSKVGYALDLSSNNGWNVDPTGSVIGAAGSITTYIAQWTPVSTYTVEYTFSPAAAATVSGLPATINTAVYGQTVGGTAPNPVSANAAYVFCGNYKIYIDSIDTGMLTTTPTSVTVAGNMKFEALFDVVSATAVTVSFDTNGGIWTAAGNTAYPGGTLSNLPGSALTAPTAADITRDGYDLTGFTPTVPAVFPGVNTSYVAQWAAKTYTVNFNQGTNGTLSANPVTSTVAYSGTATVPALTVAGGYAFLGWQNSIDGGLYDDAAAGAYPIRADVTFTAQYAPVSAGTATVVFNYAGGTDGTNGFQVITGAPGTPVSVPTGLSRTGYVQDLSSNNGWDIDPTGAVIGAAGSITIYTARWTPVAPASYTVTFTFGTNGAQTAGDTTALSQTVLDGGTVSAVPAVTAQGNYVFLGWTTGSSTTKYSPADILTMPIHSNMTFTAAYQQFSTIISGGGSYTQYFYALAFQENGGSAVMPVCAAAGTKVELEKYVTTRTGYLFDGWYTDEELTQKVSGVNLNGNMVLYAGWKQAADISGENHSAYMNGYTDQTIRPNGALTRAETAVMLYRLLTSERRSELTSTASHFTDVADNAWYYTEVSAMSNGGYIKGYVDGSFGGSRSITRGEFVAMLVRFVGVDRSASAAFTDVSENDWSYQYIATATKAGWIMGYEDGSFKSNQNITRAEAMAVVNRMLGRGVDGESNLSGAHMFPDNPAGAWYYYEVIEATNSHTFTGTRPSENWINVF